MWKPFCSHALEMLRNIFIYLVIVQPVLDRCGQGNQETNDVCSCPDPLKCEPTASREQVMPFNTELEWTCWKTVIGIFTLKWTFIQNCMTSEDINELGFVWTTFMVHFVSDKVMVSVKKPSFWWFLRNHFLCVPQKKQQHTVVKWGWLNNDGN